MPIVFSNNRVTFRAGIKLKKLSRAKLLQKIFNHLIRKAIKVRYSVSSLTKSLADKIFLMYYCGVKGLSQQDPDEYFAKRNILIILEFQSQKRDKKISKTKLMQFLH
jgi:hypothetical protein